jgi:hypothetical protein
MHNWTNRARMVRWLLAGSVVGALLGGTGIVVASADTITACVNQSTSVFKLSTIGTCAQNETTLTWNQIGPAGPQGPQGQAGPQGPAGVPGPTFLTGRTIGVPGNTLSFGTVSGFANASASQTAVQVLSPSQPMTATRVTFVPTGTVGSQGMNVFLAINGVAGVLACHIQDPGGCSRSGNDTIPPSSRLSIWVANYVGPAPGDMLATVELH